MDTRLSKAEQGVWGRRATEEERDRLQQFVVDYQRQAGARRSTDAEKLRTMVRRYALSLGMSPDDAARLVAKNPSATKAGKRAALRRQQRIRLLKMRKLTTV
jgi:hypothetical protein